MAPEQPLHLRLAGVTRLSLAGRGPKDAFVFDPHRLALPCWALALGGGPPALLVTLDRHLDLVPPREPVPPASAGVRALDEHSRWNLDARNVDHVLGAMDAGLVGDAVVIARSRLPGAIEADRWKDRRGGEHRIVVAPSLDHLAEGFGGGDATDAGREAETLLRAAPRVLLDVDLDCFTTLSDADPTAVVPWPRALIREFLFPQGSEPFWEAVLSRCVALTLAREPVHCGGLVAAGRLFEDAAEVIFRELLRADLP